MLERPRQEFGIGRIGRSHVNPANALVAVLLEKASPLDGLARVEQEFHAGCKGASYSRVFHVA